MLKKLQSDRENPLEVIHAGDRVTINNDEGWVASIKSIEQMQPTNHIIWKFTAVIFIACHSRFTIKVCNKFWLTHFSHS